MNLTVTTGIEYEYSGGDQRVVYRAMQERGIRCMPPSSWHRTREADHWDLKTDATCGWEITSPVLKTFEQLVDAAHVATIIRNCGGRVNDRCGLHVHTGTVGLIEQQLENIFRFLTRYEQAFFLVIPPSRRGNTYCKRLPAETCDHIRRHHFLNDNWWLDAWRDKNVWLNGRRYPDIRTIEFRLMPGTLDVNFILGYVTFLQCVINVVKDKTINWGIAKSRDERSLFQTMLGQAGFYGPWTTPEQKTLCVTGRKWAIERYIIANDVREMTAQAMRSSNFDDCIPTYRVSHVTPNIPTVDLRPTWERVVTGEASLRSAVEEATSATCAATEATIRADVERAVVDGTPPMPPQIWSYPNPPEVASPTTTTSIIVTTTSNIPGSSATAIPTSSWEITPSSTITTTQIEPQGLAGSWQ
jgi:hypothetical protein